MLGVINGADRDRTDDLLNAIQALSQLSYSPTGEESQSSGVRRWCHFPARQSTPQLSDYGVSGVNATANGPSPTVIVATEEFVIVLRTSI